MDDIDELEVQSEQRQQDLRKAESALIDRLRNDGLIEVWARVKARIHCEKFLASRTGRTVADRLIRSIVEAQTEWLLAPDPRALEIVEAHRRAQASHMALFCLDEIMSDGAEAETDLNRIAQEIGDDD